ncbi:MAG: carboxypeptidase regulatory-like domain-containing protein [Rhodospirillaceae bacterium]
MIRILVFLVVCLSIGSPVRAEISGAGTLSGTVTSDGPFIAAKVYAQHQERPVLFMVYTQDGTYRAPNLMPGPYAVTVRKDGFRSNSKMITIVAGETVTADIVMQATEKAVAYTGSRTLETLHDEPLIVSSYEEIFPPGPGRDILEEWCIVCHGVNFIPRQPTFREGWEAHIDFMTNVSAWGREGAASMMPPEALAGGKRELVLDYLSENFGEDKPPRAVSMPAPALLDEGELGKAMYVEYQFANTEKRPNRWTQEPHFDNEGNVWVTERGVPSGMTRLNPWTGEYVDYDNPNPKGSPHGVVIDSEGDVWWAGRDVHLARLKPKTGEIREYKTNSPNMHGHTPVLDSEENVWFTMLTGNSIGKWDRATDKITIWESPVGRDRPYGIFVSPDDKIWYAKFHDCGVAMFDPETETFTQYKAKSEPCAVRRLGQDGNGIVWYGLFSRGILVRLDPSSGEQREIKIPTAISEPYDVWPDPRGNVWISDGAQEGVLIRFNQETEDFTFYPSPQRTDFPKVAITREGAVWYAPRMVARTKGGPAGLGVLYPDKDKMTTYGAYY